ncbi:MAG TPA: hypothetical protein VGO03_00660 [Acidimicrobiia bacterium]|jgi:uncharacterized delta-60 repeat protein
MRKWVGMVAGIALLVGAMATPAVASTPTGVLDTSFHSSGEVAIGSAWTTSALAPAPNNGLYLALQSNTSRNEPVHVARLTSAGRPDPTFGSGGHTDVSLGIGDYNASYELVPDGAGLLVVINDVNRSFGLVRLTANGKIDTTFGSGGRVVFTYASGQYSETIQTAHVLADGLIELVLQRLAFPERDTPQSGGLDLVRLRANGSPDSTLAPYGIKNLVNWSGQAEGERPQAAFTSDGKVYLALPYSAGRSILERRTTSGVFDPTFHSNGVRPYACPDWQHIPSGPILRVDALGRPLLFCTLTAVENPVQNDVFVARLTTAGAADNTFGSDGHFRAWLHYDGDIDDNMYGTDATDRVVFAYLTDQGAPTHLHLARFTSAGIADSTFGTSGASTVTFSPRYRISAGLAFGPNRIYASMYDVDPLSEIAIAVRS